MSTRWEHLSQIPEEVRLTMGKKFAQWSKQDLGIENMLDLMLQNPAITAQVCRTLQSCTNGIRVPELCQVLKAAHPALSWRSVFRAVGLFCGLHLKHVQRLYYSTKRSNS